jgi:hypothetical protein
MGVVKLLMPRHFHETWLSAHPLWKHYTAMAMLQLATLTQVIWLGVGKWKIEPRKAGLEVMDPKKTYFKPIRFL